MTINYTTLLGLAKPVTGTETGQWGDVVNDQITSMLEDAVANAATVSVTAGNVTLTTANGSTSQSRMSTLIITGTPGTTRNVVAPSQAKIYQVINQSNGAVVIKGSATTGCTIAAGASATVVWNGTDFVEITSTSSGRTFNGNIVVNGTVTARAAATQDAVVLQGRAGGTSSYTAAFTPTTLTASRTVTIPDATFTLAGININQTLTGVQTLSPTARASGVASYFTLTTPADTGQTASTESIGANFTAGTRTWATGALTLQRERVFAAPTYAFATASTLTTAVNVDIATPAAGTNATITNAWALRSGPSLFVGNVRTEAAATQDAVLLAGRAGGTSSFAVTVTPATLTASRTFTLPDATTTAAGLAVSQTFTGIQTLSPTARSSGVASYFTLTTPADTGQTASTESIGANFTAATRTWATGALTLQRERVFAAPTYAFATASTLTTAVNVDIAAPAAGTNATITNAYALRAAASQFTGTVSFAAGAVGTPSITTTGDTNTGIFFPAADTIAFAEGGVEAMRIDSSGNLGIGTSSPSGKVDAVSNATAAYVARASTTGANQTANALVAFNSDASLYALARYRAVQHIWDYAGTTEGMRLDVSGNLGIGTSSPGAKLDVVGAARASNATYKGDIIIQQSSTALAGTGGLELVADAATSGYGARIQSIFNGVSAYDLSFQLRNNSASWTQYMLLDRLGNLGLGVTPSAWSGVVAMQLPTGASLTGFSNTTNLVQNAYYNGSWRYISTAAAALAQVTQGAHQWFVAPSGTAGNAITFTQAMTLDASGNLGVGTTSPDTRLHVDGSTNTTIRVTSATNTDFRGFGIGNTESDGTEYASLKLNASSGELRLYVGPNTYGGFQTFYTNGSERARITLGGEFLVGRTSAVASEFLSVEGSNTNFLSRFRNTSATTPAGMFVSYTAAAPNGTGSLFLRCDDNAATRAEIRSNGGLANYQANDVNLSDRREKTNFAPAKDYLDTICAIPVQTFNYIDQSEDDPGLTLGVVAQDVQAVAPELVQESNWGTEDEPKMRLSVYQTDLQYALMKCIQEQQAIITDLRARVAALESQP